MSEESTVINPEIVSVEENKVEENKKEFSLQQALQSELTGFLHSYVQKLTNRNELKDKIVSQIMERMDDPEQISLPALIRLLEIVNKDDTDKSLGVLKAISDTTRVIKFKDDTSGGGENNKPTNPYNQKEIEQSKKLLKLLDIFSDIGITEFSQEEIDKIKNKK